MRNYLDLLQNILENGERRPNRTGIDTIGLFGCQLRWNLQHGFPAVTTKRLAFNVVKGELLAFLAGCNTINEFHAWGVHIWDENEQALSWREKQKAMGLDVGNLGRIYGVQWRQWRGPDRFIDQLQDVIDRIKTNPGDRRLIVTAWNPGELEEMCLPPCHMFMQFYPGLADNSLSMSFYMRSADMFLGVPFNIASYALLLSMVAQVTGRKAKELVLNLGDAHIYSNHVDQVREQLTRKPYPLPNLILNPFRESIDGWKLNDIELDAYQHHQTIKAAMAV